MFHLLWMVRAVFPFQNLEQRKPADAEPRRMGSWKFCQVLLFISDRKGVSRAETERSDPASCPKPARRRSVERQGVVASRQPRCGDLLRVGRGLYVLPLRSRFGSRVPSVRKTVEALVSQRGERIAFSGAMAAYALGLTTQVPVRPVLLTSVRNRKLKLGKQEVELRHASPWQLVLSGRKAEDAVRALVWLGPERAGAALHVIAGSLSSEERGMLADVSAQMPGWLAGPVSQLPHG